MNRRPSYTRVHAPTLDQGGEQLTTPPHPSWLPLTFSPLGPTSPGVPGKPCGPVSPWKTEARRLGQEKALCLVPGRATTDTWLCAHTAVQSRRGRVPGVVGMSWGLQVGTTGLGDVSPPGERHPTEVTAASREHQAGGWHSVRHARAVGSPRTGEPRVHGPGEWAEVERPKLPSV